MEKVLIDIGHGGTDPGAVAKIKEADYTLIYGLELGKVLASLGAEIKYSRTTDTFVSLADRAKTANQWGAKYFVSLHFNAGGGTGIETFALAPGGNAERLAKTVQASLIESTGMANRGVKFSNFQVLRDTSMPAILIEGGFVDSADAEKIKTEQYKKDFVRGASKGICAFLGLAWKDPYAVAPAPAQPQPKPVDDPDVYLSVRVRTSKADKLVQDIIAMGYACKRMDLA